MSELLRADLAAVYPQYGVTVAHAGLVLAPPTDVELFELVPLVAEPGGIVEPGRERAFLGWAHEPGPDAVDAFLRAAWRWRERPTAGRWRAPFAVLDAGRAVGMAMLAHDAAQPAGTVSTWSWLARADQGRGLGRRVRLMLLDLAFSRLGADRALTSANEANAASRRVSARCGYRETGSAPDVDGREVHYAITPAAWRRRRLADVEVDGLEPFAATIDGGARRDDRDRSARRRR